MRLAVCFIVALLIFSSTASAFPLSREEKRERENKEFAQRFKWWPTDALPGPVEDMERGGYWWWPQIPGEVEPLWGNRGYIYVRKIIFQEGGKPALLIKRIVKNVKIYFDYDKAEIREDAENTLRKAAKTMKREPETEILITGNCDVRGPESYNVKLGRRRADAVREFMLANGVPEDRIRILSRGKLDAVAPVTDLVGMQKDRNAHFMIAEVVEIEVPESAHAPEVEAIIEEVRDVETPVHVETKEYVVKKGDTLWKIAELYYGEGKGYRWKYIYELNKDRIKDPNKLKAGTKILLPVE